MEGRTVVATLEVGGLYRFNFAASPSGSGTFEGWTDFGWVVFTDSRGEVSFYNPALLCTLQPESFESTIAPGRGERRA